MSSYETPVTLPFSRYTLQWWHCALGGLFGILGAAVGVLTLIIVGVCAKVFERLRERIRPLPSLLRRVVPPLVGGVLFGLLGVACPLTLGTGESQLGNVVEGSLLQSGVLGAHHYPNFNGE
jgi:H+/Cl- antiporter ClcA